MSELTFRGCDVRIGSGKYSLCLDIQLNFIHIFTNTDELSLYGVFLFDGRYWGCDAEKGPIFTPMVN